MAERSVPPEDQLSAPGRVCKRFHRDRRRQDPNRDKPCGRRDRGDDQAEASPERMAPKRGKQSVGWAGAPPVLRS